MIRLRFSCLVPPALDRKDRAGAGVRRPVENLALGSIGVVLLGSPMWCADFAVGISRLSCPAAGRFTEVVPKLAVILRFIQHRSGLKLVLRLGRKHAAVQALSSQDGGTLHDGCIAQRLDVLD